MVEQEIKVVRTEPSFMDASQEGDPMAQLLKELSIPAGALTIMGINSLVVGDFQGAAATLIPAAGEVGIYNMFYSIYKKMPQDKKEQIKRRAILVKERVDAAVAKGARLTADTASIALGIIFTSGGIGGYVSHMLQADVPNATAGVALTGIGLLQIYEGGTGEIGRIITGQPRKYPFILDRLTKFYKELPKT